MLLSLTCQSLHNISDLARLAAMQDAVEQALFERDGVVRAHFVAAVATDASVVMNRGDAINGDDLHRAGRAAHAAADAFVRQNLRPHRQRIFQDGFQRRQQPGTATRHGGRELVAGNSHVRERRAD